MLDDGPVFIDTISVRNFSTEHLLLPLSLAFSTTFESMFVLRGAPVGKRGHLQSPEWDGTALRFAYQGADAVLRTLLVEFSVIPVVAPLTAEQSTAHFQLDLAPMATAELMVTCRVDATAGRQQAAPVGRRSTERGGDAGGPNGGVRGVARRLRRHRDAEPGTGRGLGSLRLPTVALLEVRTRRASVHFRGDALVRRPVRPRQPAADDPVPHL